MKYLTPWAESQIQNTQTENWDEEAKPETEKCVYCDKTSEELEVLNVSLEPDYDKENICIQCIKENLKLFLEYDEMKKYKHLKNQI